MLSIFLFLFIYFNHHLSIYFNYHIFLFLPFSFVGFLFGKRTVRSTPLEHEAAKARSVAKRRKQNAEFHG